MTILPYWSTHTYCFPKPIFIHGVLLFLPDVVLLTRFHIIKLTLLKFKVSSNVIQLAQTTFLQSFFSFNIWKYEILFQICNILLAPSTLRL